MWNYYAKEKNITGIQNKSQKAEKNTRRWRKGTKDQCDEQKDATNMLLHPVNDCEMLTV